MFKFAAFSNFDRGEMASLMNKPKAELTPEELEEREKHEFQTGPLSVLTESVRNNTQVLINCRNNRKLMGRVKVKFSASFPFFNFRQAFDRHCNMVLENVKEMWVERPKTSKGKGNYRFYVSNC